MSEPKTYDSGFSTELIEAVVNFWAEGLSPEGTTPEHEENNKTIVEQHPAPIARTIGQLQSALKPKPEKIEVFKVELRKLLARPIDDTVFPQQYGVISSGHVELFVDYNAFGLLKIAADRAGVSDMAFPTKTRVIVHVDRAYVEGVHERYLYVPPGVVALPREKRYELADQSRRWRDLWSEALKKRFDAGRAGKDLAPYEQAVETYRASALAVEKELDTGRPHCTCCLLLVEDCATRLQHP